MGIQGNQIPCFSQGGRNCYTLSTMQVLGKTWNLDSVLVADGAWGTEFFKRGLMQGCPPDEWNLTHSGDRQGSHARVLRGGCRRRPHELLRSQPLRLEAHGLSERMREINTTGAALAREIAGSKQSWRAIWGRPRFLPWGRPPPRSCTRFLPNRPEPCRWRRGLDRHRIHDRHGGDGGRRARGVGDDSSTRCRQHDLQPNSPGIPHDDGQSARGLRAARGGAGASVIGANCGSGIEDYVPLAPTSAASRAFRSGSRRTPAFRRSSTERWSTPYGRKSTLRSFLRS